MILMLTLNCNMLNRTLTGYQVSKEFYDMFFQPGSHLSIREYLDNSYCDDISEVNLKTDAYELLYYVESKYHSPVKEGLYSSLYSYSIDYLIHPDDLKIFRKMMNPKNIMKQFANSDTPNFFFIHVRRKLQDGKWRWIELAFLTGEENGFAPGVFRIYAFDIENVKERELGNKTREEKLSESNLDDVTGLLQSKVFIENAINLFEEKKNKGWCIVLLDIEHFRLFDEWFGREQGNYLLAKIGRIINQYIKQNGGIAGYFGQDDFSLLVPYQQAKIRLLFENIKNTIYTFKYTSGFTPAMGICKLRESKGINDAIDKASVAVFRGKNDLKDRIKIYDPEKQISAEKEYHIMLDFMDALKNGEITFYLQPQVRLGSGQIVGAEALARWIKPNGEMVSPGIFVPILEKYGFVTELDKYIWDLVCQNISKWMKAGHRPIPISVNVSRIDIFNIDIAEHFEQLTAKYNLPHELIKIEITESAYAETTTAVRDLVIRLRDSGFIVLMDDFGSGYSSLNMLGSLKVDAIKLDALFLNIKDENLDRGVRVLESVINMAKQIAIPTIVEGVETEEQRLFLQDLGCRYAQGFYFYRPMPKEQFEKIVIDESKVDYGGFVVKTNEQFRVREFFDEHILTDSMLNNILGAVAYYSWDEKSVDIVRFNQQFYISVNVPDFQQRLCNIERFMPSNDVIKLHNALKIAKEKRLNGSEEVLRFYKTDGTLSTYMMRFYYIGEQEGTSRYYGSANNITSLADLKEKLDLISRFSSSTIIFMKRIKKEDKWQFEVLSHGLSEATMISKQEFEDGLNNRSLYQYLSEANAKMIKTFVVDAFKNKHGIALQYEFTRKDGTIIPLKLKADPVDDEISNVEFIITIELNKKQAP